MPRKIPRARALAGTDDRLFPWLVFGLMTATTASAAIATGIALQILL
jgi:hypothetical protein